MHIPEIGDVFELIKPWTFTLHMEYRNDLWKLLDADNHPSLSFKKTLSDTYQAEQKEINARMINKEEPRVRTGLWGNSKENYTYKWRDYATPEDRQRFQALSQMWNDLEWNDRTIPVTLPTGTQLKVDRIYIRKGASDYSSLTFYIQQTSLPALQPVKKGGKAFSKGRKRFWAKLADVNTMMVQPVALEK
jgi:hypothetical protein